MKQHVTIVASFDRPDPDKCRPGPQVAKVVPCRSHALKSGSPALKKPLDAVTARCDTPITGPMDDCLVIFGGFSDAVGHGATPAAIAKTAAQRRASR
jgi:hypothetical protein